MPWKTDVQGHERPEGDFCPICTLSIPLPMHDHAGFNVCCMKMICHGCIFAAEKRGMHDCPFCRTNRPVDDAGELAMVRARVLKKDPEAICKLAGWYFHGELGVQKDMRKAVELWTEAAGLGSVQALNSLGISYCLGNGVQEDKVKGIRFLEKAAMQGHVDSRYQLGWVEENKGNYDRAVRHLLISAKMGDEDSLKRIKDWFMSRLASKDQYTEALKGYQEAVEETKSHDRDEAKRLGYY